MQNQQNQRQSIRLKEYDYAQPGAYFVTVVSHQRQNFFGEIIDGEIILNQVGEIVEQTWVDIPKHFPNVNVDIFVIMPNHIHGIINIIERGPVGATHESPLPESLPKSPKPEPPHKSTTLKPRTLGVIVGLFKSTASKRIHSAGLINHHKIWQRNYYEHIIRDEDDHQQIADYIETNPLNWEYDHENLAMQNLSSSTPLG
jgi:REP element-mobilizing transposase RayT